MAADRAPSFSSQFSFGKDGNLTGWFGLNVLDDLIAGIDDHMAAAAAGRQSARSLGSAMLGAFMWLDEPELLKRIADCPHACVVFTKQPRPFPQAKLVRLRETLDRCPGFPAAALPEPDTHWRSATNSEGHTMPQPGLGVHWGARPQEAVRSAAG